MRDTLCQLLDRLLVTHSPSGQEEEMADLCRELLADCCDEVHTDPNGNVIGKIAGRSSDDGLLLMAHKDEISTIIRKIDDDGKMWLEPLGGCVPWVYGEGPFDVLGDEVITGILSVGSRHSSHLSTTIADAKSKALTWEMCYLDCKLTAEELAARGVRVGSRACVARSRKTPTYIGECVAAYGLDDKAAVAVLLLVGRLVRERDEPPSRDLYLAVTGAEEVGITGGAYVARRAPAGTQIAVEVAPVAPEYPIKSAPEPVIFYKDAMSVYHKGLADELAELADEVCGGHQRLIARNFGSDAGVVSKYGYSARAGCVGFATENTHGCEIGHLGGIENCARLLAECAARGGDRCP